MVTARAALTVIVKALVATDVETSVTLTLNGKVPAAAGVPEITPVVPFKLTPEGSEPELIVQA